MASSTEILNRVHDTGAEAIKTTGTVADGSNAALGAKADTAATTDGGTFSLIALVKRLLGKLPGSLSADRLKVALVSSSGSDLTGNPGSAAVTSVNDTATSTTLITSNAAARERVIQNDSTSILYIKHGTAASATDYTVKLGADDVWATQYTGRIDGIWSADTASGAAKITEHS